MRKIVIMGDSTADLNAEIRGQHGIEYVQMNYAIDGKEYPASLDWEYHSAKDFYDMMRGGKRITTTQVPRNVYEEKFTYWLEQGCDIVYIACSSALSGSVNFAKVIAKELTEKYPEAKIACIDSLISSLGQGFMLITAAKMRDAGKSFEEIVAYIEENKLCVNQCGTVSDLKYLKQAGRVTASSAFFGNLFGVKPIIISDIKGRNFAIEKVKGAMNAKHKIAEHLANAVSEEGLDCLYISHADCIEDAEELRDCILKRKQFKNVIIGTIGPIVGSCVGPGTIIAFCFGERVTVEGSE